MKLILLVILSIPCFSNQKEIKKEEVKNIVDKYTSNWFKQKSRDPIIIKVNENNILRIETNAKDTPESLPRDAGDGKEGISSSSSLVSPTENANNLENNQVKDSQAGSLQSLSKSGNVVEKANDEVKEVIDGIAKASLTPVLTVLSSANDMISQQSSMSGERIKKGFNQSNGAVDSDIEEHSPREKNNALAMLSTASDLDSTRQQTIDKVEEELTKANGISPSIQTHLPSPLQLVLSSTPSLTQTNAASENVKNQLQASSSTIPIDVKPKLEINPASEVNQLQQATNLLRTNYNDQQTRTLNPQLPNFDFMFGNIFNTIPKMVIPQIQQAIPQLVPPVIYPILPKLLTPILPPIVSNIFFPIIPNLSPQQDRNKKE